jgi:c-di-GMP-binding flagellar brake protein YcgR
VDVRHQFGASYNRRFVDARRCPRFKLEANIRVYPRDCPVVRGRTVDISESGIAAILMVEVPVGKVVRLEFTLSDDPVAVHALVRQRNAFRYGFQFVDADRAQALIARACRQLEMEQSLRNATSS